ncbi:MAG TPA: response regulator transcription factor [Candidatus Paceibacterota bacterium]|nr:response regulator transcription factor [Candidatus Paceibacterota bacterium]HRZ58026.1 response regulator transcription factor [Candidatus Paceibacterota bacterium]
MPATSKPITVAVVDDDAEFRQLVRETLLGASDLQCRAECASGEAALAELPALRPDVVLLDIVMPGISGIDCLRRLRPLLPEARFMMLTVFEDYDRIFESLRAGATGYLIKRGVAPRLVESVRDLAEGQSPISPSIARKVIQTFQQAAPTDELSRREREILEWLARGRQYKEIAQELGVALNTVRTHVGRIYKKLHVHNGREAVARLEAKARGGGSR